MPKPPSACRPIGRRQQRPDVVLSGRTGLPEYGSAAAGARSVRPALQRRRRSVEGDRPIGDRADRRGDRRGRQRGDARPATSTASSASRTISSGWCSCAAATGTAPPGARPRRELMPNFAYAFYNAGIAHQRAKRFNQMAERFTTSCTWPPTHPNAEGAELRSTPCAAERTTCGGVGSPAAHRPQQRRRPTGQMPVSSRRRFCTFPRRPAYFARVSRLRGVDREVLPRLGQLEDLLQFVGGDDT